MVSFQLFLQKGSHILLEAIFTNLAVHVEQVTRIIRLLPVFCHVVVAMALVIGPSHLLISVGGRALAL